MSNSDIRVLQEILTGKELMTLSGQCHMALPVKDLPPHHRESALLRDFDSWMA